jgi:hypothetical protein
MSLLMLGSERSPRSLSPPRRRVVPGGTNAGVRWAVIT